MASVQLNFQNMKEKPFPTSTEPPGLVQAFLDLDEGSSASDEEFLDFQFRIADANATLQEREGSEQMADWRASFASLQLKQAHEVAEFALARRREDELRIDRQAKEIIDLRRTLQACRVETEQLKANCALLAEEKLKLEEVLAHQVHVCQTFRENVSEINETRERVTGENIELKRSLNEAVVTTARLKVALEEKAAELVVWLGHEGLAPQGLSTQSSEDDLSPKADEKKAYTVPAAVNQRSEGDHQLVNLLTEEESFGGILTEEKLSEEEDLLTAATEKMIITLEEELEDMKHEVRDGNPTYSESRGLVQDSSLPCKEISGFELSRDGLALDILSSKEREVVLNLRKTVDVGASETISFLKDEINRLEAQSFSDQFEREEEVSSLKEELANAKRLIEEAHKQIADEQQTVVSLREELESSKLGWAAEQEFINSCFGGGKEESDRDENMVRREDMYKMEKKLEDLMVRLEENERELGELLIISGVDSDAVVCAKIRRLEQRLADAKSAEEVLAGENALLALQVDLLKAKLAEVENELQVENQQHVDMLLRYEEDQGHLEASTRSETGMVNAELYQMEHLLAEKNKQLELLQGGQDLSASQTQLLTLRARVLTLESNLAVTRQKAMDCEAAIKSQINREKEKYSSLESMFVTLQSNFAALKNLLTETEQRERRAQIDNDKLTLELGIAKEEVLRYEVRLQKTVREAKEDVEIEKRKHEETISSQKQLEWHLCRQLELTEGLEREKAKIREILVEFELQNLALQKESDNLKTAYMQLARQTEQRSR